MHAAKPYQFRRCFLLALFLLALNRPIAGESLGIIEGRVVDPLGAAVPNGKVILLRGDKNAGATMTNQEGLFAFSSLSMGRYHVRVEAAGFETKDSSTLFLPSGGTVKVDVGLQIGPLRQQIVVSATGTGLPESQVGASVSVLDREDLQDLGKLDVLEALRTVPGVQVVQTGQRGGTTSVFVRGGNADFNKVLVDGIPVNDVGGAFEFANLSTSGVDNVEILRGPNSVLYGSDALGSVINVTTRQGTSTVPEFSYAVDGGNFRTLRQAASLAGAFHQFDYFSEFSRFDTQNSLPNNSFHNWTYAGNFGWAPKESTSIRLTVRRTAAGLGDPNALGFFGIPDDSRQKEDDTYLGLAVQNQPTPHWHDLVQVSSTRFLFHFINPSPTGTPFDPSAGTPFDTGPNYLGNTVTICGANGYCTTGQAILDFGGTYPQTFDSSTAERSVHAQSDYTFSSSLAASFGVRYQHEDGFTVSNGSLSSTVRDNYSSFLEAHGNLWRRAYATAGLGFEDNAVFGFAPTPRLSLAFYLRRPSSNSFFGETKLNFNFGKGIKEPSIFDQGSSLFALLSNAPRGSLLISKFGISPIGPERSRSFDFGVDQGLWNDRARIGVTFFHETFYDLIEFVNASALHLLGVPTDVAAASGFGATVNSDSYRSLGAEAQVEASLTRELHVKADYTYLDAVVTRSFASSALQPAFNPAFPNIPIGAFSPLVGARPFNRAPHSGSLLIDYSPRRFGLSLAGYFVSRQDTSTFLTDGFFRNSLLLPNRDLNAGYQKIDLSGRYPVNRLLTAYFSIENLFSQHYQQSFGFPSLPLTFRAGLKFTFGGEKGWWK